MNWICFFYIGLQNTISRAFSFLSMKSSWSAAKLLSRWLLNLILPLEGSLNSQILDLWPTPHPPPSQTEISPLIIKHMLFALLLISLIGLWKFPSVSALGELWMKKWVPKPMPNVPTQRPSALPSLYSLWVDTITRRRDAWCRGVVLKSFILCFWPNNSKLRAAWVSGGLFKLSPTALLSTTERLTTQETPLASRIHWLLVNPKGISSPAPWMSQPHLCSHPSFLTLSLLLLADTPASQLLLPFRPLPSSICPHLGDVTCVTLFIIYEWKSPNLKPLVHASTLVSTSI